MRPVTRRHWLGQGALLAGAGWLPRMARAAALPAAIAALLTDVMAAATLGEVRPARSTRRIVSVGGALTETLYALGAESELVGVDSTSLHPAAARALPNVGYARTLSAEGLLALAPTLVVATEDAGPPAVLRQLEAARVPLEVLDSSHRYEGLLARVRRLGEITDRRDEATRLIDRLTQEWRAAQALVRNQPGPAPRVLFILSHVPGQARVAGRGTAADAMLGYAGASNVMAAFDGYKPLTPEAAIAAAPEVLLVTTQGLDAAGGIDGLLALPGLAQTPAGRARRVVAFDALALLGFGPRMPALLGELAVALRRRAATA
ncbi:heme/hemin ABC transporter substrate-binding protein [Derxia lacustris]|uniref:heme/hemin ABC transporter substrate-binding protein n=1 Tax=Derxia lacustris TaxID=764842 RepID=UPI001F38A6B4|nr:ABC transporter substrate-binding protein [Derxia lacustris]